MRNGQLQLSGINVNSRDTLNQQIVLTPLLAVLQKDKRRGVPGLAKMRADHTDCMQLDFTVTQVVVFHPV